MELFYIILGLIFGFFVAWLFSKKKAKAQTTLSQQKIDELNNQIVSLKTEKGKVEERYSFIKETYDKQEDVLKEEREKVLNLSSKLSGLNVEYSKLKEKLEEHKKEIEDLQNKFKTEFENLANKILDDTGKKFADQNKTNLDEILKPLGDKIKDFEKKVVDTYDAESKQRFHLEKEIKNLIETTQRISKDATDLTQALKGQAKILGNWGEIILESILEKSGLVKDREYFIQQSFTDAEGKRLQPDVVVHYPGNKSIIVDSKVSLASYDRYSACEDKIQQEIFLAEHINAIKSHIVDLSKKNYQNIYQINTLEFVIMFVPIEPAFLIAVQKDNELWNFAYEKRILLISPTNLLVALKMIQNIWQQEYQSKNAMEIARQSGALYDKFVSFVEDLINVGNKIRDAQKSYEDAMKKLHTGSGNLVRRAESIKELGAKTTKSLPQTLLDRAD